MTESTLQGVQIIKLLICVVAAGLYGYGGISNKWLRRYLAPAVLTAGVLGVGYWVGNFSWWFALWYVGLAICFSIGYGVNSFLMLLFQSKWKVRAFIGLLITLAALAVAIPMGAWLALVLHGVFCIVGIPILGAFNPTKSARAEETMIGFIAGFVPLLAMI